VQARSAEVNPGDEIGRQAPRLSRQPDKISR